MKIINIIEKLILVILGRRYSLLKFTLLLVCGIFAINIVEDLMFKYEQSQSSSVKSRVLRENSETDELESNKFPVNGKIPQNGFKTVLTENRIQLAKSRNTSGDNYNNLDSDGLQVKLLNISSKTFISRQKHGLTKSSDIDSSSKDETVISKRKFKCPDKLNLDSIHYICKPQQIAQSQLTLFTVISNISVHDVFIINNTLTIWSKLMPEIRPVLFIDYSGHDNEGNRLLDSLVDMACHLRWTVLQCPHCREGLPVLGSMFQTVYAIGDTTWYGYAQHHVLFDNSLLAAIEKLQFYIRKIRPYGLLAGSQYIVKLNEGTSIKDHSQLEKQTFNATRDESGMAAYMITKKWGYPWTKLPPLVIGEPDLETFYLWYSIFYKPVFNMDVTDMIFATGQQIKRDIIFRPEFNRFDSKTPSVYQDNSYFITNAFPGFESYLRNQKYIAEKGITKCLQFKFGYVRSPYARIFRRWVTYLGEYPYSCKVNKYTLIEPDDDAMETIDIQMEEE